MVVRVMRTTFFLAVTTALGLAASANAQTTVQMVKQNTSFALDSTSSTSPGRNAHLWAVGDHPNQQWIEIPRGDFFSYQKANSSNPALCLDGGNGGARRQPVVMQVCDAGNLNQQWDKIAVSNGSFRLEKRNTNFSIDGNVGGAKGQDVYLWSSASGNVNQQWRFSGGSAPVTPTPPTTPTPQPAPPGSTFRHRVTFEGESVDITFNPFSSRGPLFSVFEQASNGNLDRVNNVPDVETYIGLVDDHPDAFASALVRNNGEVLATVVFPTTRTWTDVNGTVTEETRDNTPLLPTQFLTMKAGSNLYAADVFFDMAGPFIDEAGGTTRGALEMIEYNMAAINAIFMRDAAVINRIGKIILRTASTRDPYASVTGSSAHLTQLRTLSTTEAEIVPHDLATVISPRIGGGIASVGTVSNGHSANGVRAGGNFTNVTRHELGHNWGVGHYQGGQHIEGKTIMSGNGLSKFASPAIQKILEQRIQRANDHLDNLGNVAPSLPPRAGDDIVRVSGNSSTVIQPLGNDNDVNGDSISVSSVPNQTNAGNTLTRNGNSVTLNVSNTPADGYDWFRYTIEDDTGLTSDGVVHIEID